MNKNWYSAVTNKCSAHEQGLIIEEITGKSIAVSYDPKNAKLIATSPELLEALKNLLADIEFTWDTIPSGCVGIRQLRAAQEAVAKATAE